jgi:hypothetical protein
MRTLSIATPAELRQAYHKAVGAVVASTGKSFRQSAIWKIGRIGGLKVRLHDDVRKIVAFLGARTTDATGASVPVFGGTGFFIYYPAAPDRPNVQFPYLVTAGHVAEALAGPFVVGINNAEGSLELLDVDEARWVYHLDYPSVDLAVIPMGVSGADWAPFPYEGFADHENSALFSRFGIGDLVYIVGLYRLFPGSVKMSPVVHTGHVAMTPDEELPVMNRTSRTLTKMRGYLIEAQTLEGLSGSPVFVRYTNPSAISSGVGRVAAYTDSVFLLGIWQGAFEGIADDTLGQQVGRGARVPVGMGITIPARRITEILQLPELVQERANWVRQQTEISAATTDNGSTVA